MILDETIYLLTPYHMYMDIGIWLEKEKKKKKGLQRD